MFRLRGCIPLMAIFAVGFSLRVIGANWGFPFLLHPDEASIARVPAEMAGRSSLDPNQYDHPDHVLIYLNAVAHHAASALLFGRPLVETFTHHITFYYLLSRIISALFGAICIVVAYLVGKEFREDTALIAAAIVAVFPSYITHSHYITPDMPLTALILLVILYGIRYLKSPTGSNLVRASVFSALATGVKYPGLLSTLLIATVAAQTHYKDLKKMFFVLMQAALTFLVTALVFTPYLFINYERVIGAVIYNAGPTHLGADGLGWFGNLLFYVRSYLSFAGILMSAFAVIGAVLIVRNEKRYSIPVFFGLLYWLLLSRIPLHVERWALPMYVSPLLISAYGMSGIYSRLKSRRKIVLTIACSGAIAVGLLNMVMISGAITTSFLLNDTRYMAYQFAKQNDITQENTAFEGYTPFNPESPGDAFNAFDPSPNNDRYIILSSFMYDRWMKEKDRYNAQNEFYKKAFALDLVKKFTPVRRFSDGMNWWEPRNISTILKFFSAYFRKEDLLAGPTIEILKLASGTPVAP